MPKQVGKGFAQVFGNRLRSRREALDISMMDFSEDIGVTHTAVWYYETGRNLPSVEIMYKMAKRLKCSVDYLAGQTDVAEEANYVLYAKSRGQEFAVNS